jgi:hypothetical protein
MNQETLQELRRDIQTLDVIYNEFRHLEFFNFFESQEMKEKKARLFNSFEMFKKYLVYKYPVSYLQANAERNKTNNIPFLALCRQILADNESHPFTNQTYNWQELKTVKGYTIWQGKESETEKAIYQVTNGIKPSYNAGYYYNLQALLELKNLA